MRVLIGLGNPGEQYMATRHNAGFECVEAVAEACGVSGWKEFKGGLLATVSLDGQKALLFKPMQFMNNSGQPVRQLLDYYDIPVSDVVVVADDVYVAPGSARIRQSGGDGGHNGLKSVMAHLDPDEFWRVKLGVGLYGQHPDEKQKQPALEDYVLQKLPAHDAKQLKELIDSLVPNLVEWLRTGKSLETQTLRI